MTSADASLDDLVDAWLTLPDVAERLDVEVRAVRGLISTRSLIGVKRGERTTFQVPAAFLLAGPDGVEQVVETVRGTVMLLGDAGFSDEESLRWLFSVEESLGERPIDSLRAGRRAQVRRVAQSLA